MKLESLLIRLLFNYSLLNYSTLVTGQTNRLKPFTDCHVQGSTTVYDLKKDRWHFTDSIDAKRETLPASTFKIINLLIALETGVIKSEHDTVRWTGSTDTMLYGYRPEIYKDMPVKEAFQVSAGWVFIALAEKIGRERYKAYLESSQYGNGNLSEAGTDFWNFGAFAISPVNQVRFLVKVFAGQTPFARHHVDILKRVMITEQSLSTITRSKTGWTRVGGKDWGWWVGYIEKKEGPYFFATRITKDRSAVNSSFGQCRKEITKEVLKKLDILE